jgi:DNA-binding LacI/PurR family transcriptional regulator
MTQRRASRLVDIAEAVGVHVSTVSRVLNGDPAQSIRPEVYEKILRTARQQGYRPNALARRSSAATPGPWPSSSRSCATRSG